MLDAQVLASRTRSAKGAMDWQEVISFVIPRPCRDGIVFITVGVPDASQPSGAYQWAGAEIRILGHGGGQPVILQNGVLGGAANAMEFPFGDGDRWPRISVECRGTIDGAVGQQMVDMLTTIIANGVSDAFFATDVSAVAMATIAPAPALPGADPQQGAACR